MSVAADPTDSLEDPKHGEFLQMYAKLSRGGWIFHTSLHFHPLLKPGALSLKQTYSPPAWTCPTSTREKGPCSKR